MKKSIINKATIFLHGTQVYYEQYQRRSDHPRQTIVFIHGFVSSSFSFRRLIPLLEKRYDLITVDLQDSVGVAKSAALFIPSKIMLRSSLLCCSS